MFTPIILKPESDKNRAVCSEHQRACDAAAIWRQLGHLFVSLWVLLTDIEINFNVFPEVRSVAVTYGIFFQVWFSEGPVEIINRDVSTRIDFLKTMDHNVKRKQYPICL